MVQEACLRAVTFFHSFHGEDGRAWLLAIVRNTCSTWLRKNRAQELDAVFKETIHSAEADAANPEVLLLRKADRELLQRLLEQSPTEFRVMSRLARARKRLEQQLAMRTRVDS